MSLFLDMAVLTLQSDMAANAADCDPGIGLFSGELSSLADARGVAQHAVLGGPRSAERSARAGELVPGPARRYRGAAHLRTRHECRQSRDRARRDPARGTAR